MDIFLPCSLSEPPAPYFSSVDLGGPILSAGLCWVYAVCAFREALTVGLGRPWVLGISNCRFRLAVVLQTAIIRWAKKRQVKYRSKYHIKFKL